MLYSTLLSLQNCGPMPVLLWGVCAIGIKACRHYTLQFISLDLECWKCMVCKDLSHTNYTFSMACSKSLTVSCKAATNICRILSH